MTHKSTICPVCEKGLLIVSSFSGNFQHHGKIIHVDGLECYRCDTCGADPVFEDQIHRNHLRIASARKA